MSISLFGKSSSTSHRQLPSSRLCIQGCPNGKPGPSAAAPELRHQSSQRLLTTPRQKYCWGYCLSTTTPQNTRSTISRCGGAVSF